MRSGLGEDMHFNAAHLDFEMPPLRYPEVGDTEYG